MTLRDRRRGAIVLAALAALLSFGAVLYQESFVHTDDGCRVEVHCLACRLALGTAAGVAVAAPDVTPPHVEAEEATPAAEPAPAASAQRKAPSRAPPLA